MTTTVAPSTRCTGSWTPTPSTARTTQDFESIPTRDGTDDRDDLLTKRWPHRSRRTLTRGTGHLLELTADSASVEPHTRQKFVEAASRGIQHHRNDVQRAPSTPLYPAARASLVPRGCRRTHRRPRRPACRSRERTGTHRDPHCAQGRILDKRPRRRRRSSPDEPGRALELQRREDLAVAAAAPEFVAADGDFIQEVISCFLPNSVELMVHARVGQSGGFRCRTRRDVASSSVARGTGAGGRRPQDRLG